MKTYMVTFTMPSKHGKNIECKWNIEADSEDEAREKTLERTAPAKIRLLGVKEV